jgi:hypothetical protein
MKQLLVGKEKRVEEREKSVEWVFSFSFPLPFGSRPGD